MVTYYTYKWRYPYEDRHQEIRARAIRGQIVTGGRFANIVAGDSIVEFGYLPPGTLNAGIGGATIATLGNFLPELTKSVKPKVLIIAVGVNDGAKNRSTDVAAFQSAYRQLIYKVMSHADRVIIAPPQPIDFDSRFAGHFDIATLEGIRLAIDSVSHEFNIDTIDYSPLTDNRGSLLPAYSLDGVHMTPLGYQTWQRLVAKAISGAGAAQ
jgi:lysophospholipase L1-like esterase